MLTKADHYQVTLAVEASIKIGAPPTSMIQQDKQPTDKWTMFDKKLIMAWTILDKQTCSKCGQPIWICRSTNRDLTFSVRRGMCYATREIEKKQKDKNFKLKEGEYIYIVPQMRNDAEMPSRAEWIKELTED